MGSAAFRRRSTTVAHAIGRGRGASCSSQDRFTPSPATSLRRKSRPAWRKDDAPRLPWAQPRVRAGARSSLRASLPRYGPGEINSPVGFNWFALKDSLTIRPLRSMPNRTVLTQAGASTVVMSTRRVRTKRSWFRRALAGSGRGSSRKHLCPRHCPRQFSGSQSRRIRCGIGSWGGRRPSTAPYVTGTGPKDGATASGKRSCCLSSDIPRGAPRRGPQGPVGRRKPWKLG
jgi:hypothetical protein